MAVNLEKFTTKDNKQSQSKKHQTERDNIMWFTTKDYIHGRTGRQLFHLSGRKKIAMAKRTRDYSHLPLHKQTRSLRDKFSHTSSQIIYLKIVSFRKETHSLYPSVPSQKITRSLELSIGEFQLSVE